jgi:putative sterol carrier protein
MAQNAQQELADAIRGKSDDEILLGAQLVGGVEALLDQTFAAAKDHLNPDAAKDVVIGYRLSHGPATYEYAVVVKDKAVTIEKRNPADARVTLVLTVPDYLRFITGELNNMTAFTTGRLQLEGDVMFAQELGPMFSR